MSKKIPKVIKDSFYLEWSKPSNYKDLVIKKNKINKDLEQIYNNNNWMLETCARTCTLQFPKHDQRSR